MPQADLHYTNDIPLDAPRVLADIERTIAAQDAQAGDCKGRAHRLDAFHHSHVLLTVAVLKKPHRDDAFMAALLDAITAVLDGHLTQNCARSVELRFLSAHYRTGTFEAP